MKKVVVAAQASDLGIMATNTIPDDGSSSRPEELLDHRFNMYSRSTSAPASSASAGSTYAHLSHRISTPPSESPATFGVPFNWEEKPGTPKCEFSFTNDNRCSEFDYSEFDFDSGFRGDQYVPSAVAATDEAFEKKRILPLKPPPRLYFQSVDNGGGVTSSQRPPRPPRTRRLWPFRHQSKRSEKEEEDPFTVAMVEATRESSGKDKDPIAFLAKGVVRRKWRLRGLLPLRCASNKQPGKHILLAETETKGRAIKDMGFVAAVEDSDDECNSAPETPRRYDYVYRSCTTTPSSPVHGAAIHAGGGVPFDWEEKPGIPKWLSLSKTLEEVAVADEELFEEERILPPLKPPPRLYFSRTDNGAGSASSSARLDQVPKVAAADEVLEEKRILHPLKPPPRLLHFQHTDDGAGRATSTSEPPRHHRSKMFRSRLNKGRKELDPFTIAMMEATRDVPGSDETTASSSKKWPWKKILSLGILSNKPHRADNRKTDAFVGSTPSHDSAHGMESATERKAQAELMRENSIVLRQGQLSCIPFSRGAHRRRRRHY
ncbi:hypothetical protein B296_00028925 [Ensete ventricosum]|uniref:Uncharacterized protein n=1 Tax=Ensete ventricosum TaxID=4639 RepID=A0A426Y634_ENSVE|nr:hypothetical protein B296_00028925 [Ensete ventricosum]